MNPQYGLSNQISINF